MRSVSYLLCALCVLPLYPAANAFAEDHSVILVSQANKTIYDIDPATGKILGQVTLEGTPTDAVYSWDERWWYVAVPEQGYISLVNDRTFKEDARMTRPEFKRVAGSVGLTDSLATTPNFEKLYVSVPGGVEAFDQRLWAMAPEYQQPGVKIAIPGTDVQHMLVNGVVQKLYVTYRKENQVAVIDTRTDKLLKMIPVKGGPMDVAFMIGGEAWVSSADGTVSVIDINKDEVVKTIATTGKGATRIVVAPDVRFLAATHDDTGDVTILQPMTKEVVGTVKVGVKGPLTARFTPPDARGAKPWAYPPTNELYVTGETGMVTVNLDKMTAAAPLVAGQGNVATLIHYTFAESFVPPREETETRIMENDLYTLYDNAMPNMDLSPIHEHRTDMAAVFVSDGVARLGCWQKDLCEQLKGKMGDVSGAGYGGERPYNFLQAGVGVFTGVPRGTLHEEEGTSPQPREMIIFMPKNNYYRQANPKKESSFAGRPGYRMLTNGTRVWLWEVTLLPGKPQQMPKADYAFVYLAGGLIKETRNGVPSVKHVLFKDWDTDSSEKTIEAMTNRVRLTIMEFK